METALITAPNDVDTVTSSGVLMVDANEVSAEQLRDIFEMPEELAHNIVDVRTQVVTIMDLNSLLQVPGVDEASFRRWTSEEDVTTPNTELQQALGLPTDRVVPLQELLQASMRDAKLEGLAVLTPLGLWVAGFLPEGLSHDHFLEQVPLTIHDLSDNLSKLGLAETRSFSLSTEEHDVLIQRAGVLYVVAVQSPDAFDNQVHEKLEKLRREIVRRYRPRLYLYLHAEKTPSDIVFDCPKCVLRIVIDQSASGYEIDCPKCKAALIVPDQSLIPT